jgi:hypothetical protein
MIVNRRTFNLKQGQEKSAVEAIKAFYANPDPHTLRWYISDIGPFNKLVVEIEYKDLADYEAYWSTFDPGEDFWKNWFELTDLGGANEIWQLVYKN